MKNEKSSYRKIASIFVTLAVILVTIVAFSLSWRLGAMVLAAFCAAYAWGAILCAKDEEEK